MNLYFEKRGFYKLTPREKQYKLILSSYVINSVQRREGALEARKRRERDSSGRAATAARRVAVVVLERIARRKCLKGTKRLAQNIA
jgi:hypothetical protein